MILINAAIAKFTGNEEYTAAFAIFGFGDWLAAVALAVMMAGAVVSELTLMKGNPAPAAFAQWSMTIVMSRRLARRT